MKTRIEVDPLGEKAIPENAYYGIQTLRATENFPVSGIRPPLVFIEAYVMVKKAAALANAEVGWLDEKRKQAIVQACDEVLADKLLDQFVVDVFQAGAGTSFNMNVNEVLANRALEILGKNKGDYKSVGPNDHVNMGQSTNDSFPTATHIAVLMALQSLLKELDKLADTFEELSKKYFKTVKPGRTHLQDAVPITIGQEFSAYASVIRNARNQLKERQKNLYALALGGTAVGTGTNTHPKYKQLAIAELRKMTGFPLKPARNAFEALQSYRPVQTISSAIKELALELIRIANDLRLLSSGPTTGLAEIELPPVQPGSSIMPGKVNPVMAECLDMVAFQVVGNDLTVSFAVQAGQMELNVMMPVIMHNVLFSIRILTNYLPVFRRKCVKGISVNKKRCAQYLEKNPALATFLSPHIGYLEAAKIAKQALDEGRSVKEIVLEKGVLKPEELNRILDPKRLFNKTKPS
ncbi:aspartate ammonia-lyase [miscellaneous Crenarchaeota group-1 archaeon SG8-32-3]|uniref:Aspartate ammonia-lyase n=1 Tax=miscellaneous Crenarchaeota group-1 archaeon SG8-32-3 TaxID=1685125 RepID=A0A0M0BUE5_9ARCH|nr:MAG: aspartate ammonia-lyase [miscellaneous Crenarchaeota group-1 archaeon SG8-32-3]